MSTLNSEMVKMKLNTSEQVHIEDRILVVERLSQKIANSGYKLDQIK